MTEYKSLNAMRHFCFLLSSVLSLSSFVFAYQPGYVIPRFNGQYAGQHHNHRTIWKHHELSSSEFPVTIVTGLYDIKRQSKGDGRSIDTYLEWFNKTLSIKAPMVVYIGSSEHAEFVRKGRLGQPTIIITRPLENLMFTKIRHLVEANQKNEKWQKCAKHPGRLENILPMYICIIFNKFEFMNEVATVNPYNSSYFLWVDAGGSRLMGDVDYASKHHWPNVNRLKELDPNGDKFIIPEGYPVGLTVEFGKVEDIYTYMCGDGDGFLATIFGGTAETFFRMLRQAEKFLYEEMLPSGAVGNEQMFLYILHGREKDKFYRIPNQEDWVKYLS